MIEKFSKEQFEQALSNIHMGWESLGLDSGEETYFIPVNAQARLVVRSSVDKSGFAADTGEDSIRIWIQVYRPDWRNPQQLEWQACGKKVDAYTTRVPGWQNRMEDKIRILWDKAKTVRRPVNTCPKCGGSPWVGFAKNGKNGGRPFASHRDCDYFTWLDASIEKSEVIKFDDPSPSELVEMPAKQPESQPQVKPQINHISRTMAVLVAEDDNLDDIRVDAEVAAYKAGKKQLTYKRQPNQSQLSVIEADVNEDIRVLAPPGSGKTFVIEHRYQYLVHNSVSPEEILVVTYSKKMADEMLERISKVNRKVCSDQISTIHAFCFRLLTRWDTASQFYGWEVPKDWQVKKTIDELVEKYWKCYEDEEKPGYAEIVTWINNAKHHGLTVEDSRQYFIRNLGARFGEWLYQIRRDFDAAMANQKFLLFSDMLYYTEHELKNNEQFRSRWQSRFSQIIVDECQDTNEQAMRILITLSLESGENPVYSN